MTMAISLPTRGQRDWDDELNNALQQMDASAENAKATASSAISAANNALNVAQAVQGAVIGTADAATAGYVVDGASATRAAVAEVAASVVSSALGQARTFGTQPSTNLGPDPLMTVADSTGAWYVAGSGTGGASAVTRDATGGYRSSPACVQTFSADPTAGGGGVAYGRNQTSGTGRIPVAPGQQYTVSIYACPSKALTMLARIVWLNSTGPTFGTVSTSDGASYTVAVGEHRRLVVTGTAPVGAAYMTVQARTSDLSPLGIGDTIKASRPTVTLGSDAKQHVSGSETGAFALGAANDSAIVGPPETLRIAHWGDSIAFGGTTIDSPSALLGSIFDCPVYNGGISGESSTQIRARQVADETTRDWVQIIGAGHNGASSGVGPIVTDIQAMVNRLTGQRRFLVVELLPWANHDTTQRANYNAAIAATKAAFPANFVEIATWLRTQAAATAAGITFTGTDLTDIANGNTPTSFRTDDIHLNLVGRRVYAHRLRLELAARGWATSPAGVVLT